MKEYNQNDNDTKKINETSKVVYNGTLYEQVYDPIKKTTYYLGWDKQKQETIPMDFIEETTVKYIPIKDDMLDKGAVILASGIEEYGDITTLDKDINDFIHKYLDISEEHRQKAVWYTRLSWVLDNVHTVPYLRALGDYGSGKTRYEDVIGGICYKPMFVGGSVRSAPIYRVIDLWRGTGIFDEFTLNKSDETLDIIQILNCGFQRGKPVLRCKDGNYSKVECFDPFGAKILATKKEFQDKALESRCITEILQETGRNDIPIDLGETFFNERAKLQNKLLLYRFKNLDTIKHDETKNYDFGHIQPRIKQTFLPFTVLFSSDNETLRKFIDTIKRHNTALVEENSSSYNGLIVNIFLEFKEFNPKQTVTAQDIRNDLVNKHGFNEEKTTSASVGRKIKPLGFISKPETKEGKTQRVIVINPSDLKRLIFRYVLPEKQEEYAKIADKMDTDIQQTFEVGA